MTVENRNDSHGKLHATIVFRMFLSFRVHPKYLKIIVYKKIFLYQLLYMPLKLGLSYYGK